MMYFSNFRIYMKEKNIIHNIKEILLGFFHIGIKYKEEVRLRYNNIFR